jgi:hypothetical protein
MEIDHLFQKFHKESYKYFEVICVVINYLLNFSASEIYVHMNVHI